MTVSPGVFRWSHTPKEFTAPKLSNAPLAGDWLGDGLTCYCKVRPHAIGAQPKSGRAYLRARFMEKRFIGSLECKHPA